jgi:uncharacterized protein
VLCRNPFPDLRLSDEDIAIASLMLNTAAWARSEGPPLHWAASTDDVDVVAVLIDGGGHLDTPGGSIGTPLDNAIGYGCWHVARLLVERGAPMDRLWHAAALGLLSRLERLLADGPTTEDLNNAFRQEPDAVPAYANGQVAVAAAAPDTRRDLLVTWLRERTSPPGF